MSEATSTFTMRGLVEALRYIDPKQTALIRGRHGIGKSAIAYQMAKEWGLDRVIERRISQLSEGDMIGLPDRDAMKSYDGGDLQKVTKFLPTDWFLEAEFRPCLVFLDEINRGTPETMQACFQFIEKGELNGRKIHPESRIIAAVNFSKEYQVTPMDPAFLDRFWVADLDPDKTDWVTWARKSKTDGGGGISDATIDFIQQCNEDHFEIRPDKLANMGPCEITPSRRSWERLDRHFNRTVNGATLLEKIGDGVAYDVARGFVGPDAARAYVRFQVDHDQNVSPEDVLNNISKVQSKVKRLKPDAAIALVDKLGHHLVSKNIILTEPQAKNIGTFIRLIPSELVVVLWSKIAHTAVENVKVVHKHVGSYVIEVLSNGKAQPSVPDTKKKK